MQCIKNGVCNILAIFNICLADVLTKYSKQNDIIKKNSFENVFCKMAAILFKFQFVKRERQHHQ